MNRRLIVLALTVLVVPSLAAAQAGAPPAPPKPAAELSQLKAFEGAWTCTGSAPESPFGPAHKTQATVTAAPDLNGFWYVMRYEEKTTAENPMAVKAMMFWGYDSAQKTFVGSCLDSFGGICHQTSPGWQGDGMVWTGAANMGGQKVGARDTFSLKSGTLTHKGEIEMGGKWSLLDEETCKK
jgi:hypothetical protein